MEVIYYCITCGFNRIILRIFFSLYSIIQIHCMLIKKKSFSMNKALTPTTMYYLYCTYIHMYTRTKMVKVNYIYQIHDVNSSLISTIPATLILSVIVEFSSRFSSRWVRGRGGGGLNKNKICLKNCKMRAKMLKSPHFLLPKITPLP